MLQGLFALLLGILVASEPATPDKECLLLDAGRPLTDNDPLQALIYGPSTVGTNSTFMLDGSKSYGIGVPLTYNWSINEDRAGKIEATAVSKLKHLLEASSSESVITIPANSLPQSDQPYVFVLTVTDCVNRVSEITQHMVSIVAENVNPRYDAPQVFCPDKPVAAQTTQKEPQKPRLEIIALSSMDQTSIAQVVHDEPFTLFASMLFTASANIPQTYSWAIVNATSALGFMETGPYLEIPANWLPLETEVLFEVTTNVGGTKYVDKKWVIAKRQINTPDSSLDPHFALSANFVNSTYSENPLVFHGRLLEVPAAQLRSSIFKYRVYSVGPTGATTFVQLQSKYGFSSPSLCLDPEVLAPGFYMVRVMASIPSTSSTGEEQPRTSVTGFMHFYILTKPQAFGVMIESKCDTLCVASKDAVFVATVVGEATQNATLVWTVYKEQQKKNGTEWIRVGVVAPTNQLELRLPAGSLQPGSNYAAAVTAVLATPNTKSAESATSKFKFRVPWEVRGGAITTFFAQSTNTWSVSGHSFVGDFAVSTMLYSLWLVREGGMVPLRMGSFESQFEVVLPPSPDGKVSLMISAEDRLGQSAHVTTQLNTQRISVDQSCKDLFSCSLGDYVECDRRAIAPYLSMCSLNSGDVGPCVQSVTAGLIGLADTYSTWSSCTSNLNPKAIELMNTRYIYRAEQLLLPLVASNLDQGASKQIIYALDFLLTQQCLFPPLPTFPRSTLSSVFSFAFMIVDIVDKSIAPCQHSSVSQKGLNILNEVVEFANTMCKMSHYYGRTQASNNQVISMIEVGAPESDYNSDSTSTTLSEHEESLGDTVNIAVSREALQPLDTAPVKTKPIKNPFPSESAVFKLMHRTKLVGVNLLEAVMACPPIPSCGQYAADEVVPDPAAVDVIENGELRRTRVELLSPNLMIVGLQVSTNFSGVTIAISPSSLTPDVNPVVQFAVDSIPESLLSESHFSVFAVTQQQTCSRECDDILAPVVRVEIRGLANSPTSVNMNPPAMLTLPINENSLEFEDPLECNAFWSDSQPDWSTTNIDTITQQSNPRIKQTCLAGSLPGDFTVVKSICKKPNTAQEPSPSPTPSELPPSSPDSPDSPDSPNLGDKVSSPSPLPSPVSSHQRLNKTRESAKQILAFNDHPQSTLPRSVHKKETPKRHRPVNMVNTEKAFDPIENTIDTFQNLEWLGIATAGAVIGVVIAVAMFFVVLHHSHTSKITVTQAQLAAEEANQSSGRASESTFTPTNSSFQDDDDAYDADDADADAYDADDVDDDVDVETPNIDDDV